MYLNDSGELNKVKNKVELLNQELETKGKQIEVLNLQIWSSGSQASELQAKLNEKDRLLAETKKQAERLQKEAAAARQAAVANPAPAPPAPEPAGNKPAQAANDDTVICPYCNGDYKFKWVVCERKQGVGCDGKGHRPCFECLGRCEKPCTNCGGTGKVTIDSVRHGKLTSKLEQCSICDGKSKVDCPKCDVMYVRLPLAKPEFLEPIISQGTPLGPTTVFVGGCRLVVSEYYAEWIPVRGDVICPKCNGKGKIKIKGPCPFCTEGRLEKSKLVWFKE
jgi:hypothetical protein